MEDKSNNIMNEGTGMTWMLSFMGKKLWKRTKHKGKISPSSSQMMRTISIHHLECTDFVHESEVGLTASSSESSKNALSSDSLAMSESKTLKATHGSAKGKPGEACNGINVAYDLPGSHDKFDKIENNLVDKQMVLKGKLVEARDALMKANEFANHSKIFLDREAVLDAPEYPNYISPDYVERLQATTKARMLTKSTSFPGLHFSGSAAGNFLPSFKRMKSDSFVTQGTKSESVSSFINIIGVGSDSEGLLGSHELRKRREAGTVINRLRDLKEKIKDVITENRMEKIRVSRDGILHKVPFGHKLLEDMKDKKLNLWDDSTSKRCSEGGDEGRNFNNAPHDSYSKFARRSFQRSCSLTESLDRYSQLLETLSLNESVEISESSKSILKDNGFLQGKLSKSLGRMLSSPVSRSYSFSKAVQNEVSLESSKIIVAESFENKMDKILSSNSIREDTGWEQEKLPKNFGRMLSSPVFKSYSFSMAVQSEHYLESSEVLTPERLGIVMEKIVDKPNTDAIIYPILEKNDCELKMVVDPDSLLSPEEAIKSDKFVTPTVESITEMIDSQVNPVSVDDSERIEPFMFTEVVEEEADLVNRQAESVMKPEKPSLISSLDLNMVEGSAGSAKYLLREGSELQPMFTESDEQHQLQNTIEGNKQNLTENSRTGYDDEQMESSFLIHVDHKNATLFKFVRFILSKSEYGALISFYDFETEMDTSFEQNHLNDLINEILLEIYEYSTAPNPWLLHFHSKIRSMPVGDYLLKDVWTEINWHLCAPQGLDATLDDLTAHDFAKNDGWMNLYRHAEYVALQLEYLILDDLLDEAVVDSDGFDF